MKKHIFTVLFLMLALMTFGQQWVAIDSNTPSTLRTTLISSSEDQITVNVQIPGFFATEVATPRGEANIISVPKTVSTAAAGEPNLPMIAIPAIIGDHQHYSIRVVESQHTDFMMEVAPSKGDFPRSINPEDVPYTYGEAYSADAFFPTENVGLYNPYILRDFRGQNMAVYPFAYNAATHTLRVYHNLTIELYSDRQSGTNLLDRHSSVVKMDPETGAMYANHFINYNESLGRYTPVVETGELLIICHDAFMEAMQPFVNWKKQIGRPTTMVGTSTAGTTSSAIKAYIQSQYDANPNLTHVLLVGDVAQIPGNTYSAGSYGGKSDNMYGQVAGNDLYNDIIIGRFSAENETHVTTQVNKVIHYERDINATDTWLTFGDGIGNGDGPGHFGETDWQHIENIRTDLLAYNYTTVHQDYPGVTGYSSSAAILSQHINNGVSIINYCNHGSVTSWALNSYSNSNVNALTNVNKLPIVWSVACDNGKYDHSGPCFGETWLRATNGTVNAPDPTQPTGAVGGMFSYISQPWQPPMYGHDEMVDVLVESYNDNIKRTLGGCSYDGNMKILDQYGQNDNAGKGTYLAWILYGDPTLTLRNLTPTEMGVTHATSMSSNAISFAVNATNGEGALATLTLDNEILGCAYIQNGTANITFEAPNQTGTATLTVFGYNKITYIATIDIVNSSIIEYTVNVTAQPEEGGEVNGGDIFQEGQSCTVTATAATGYKFINWSENSIEVSEEASYTFIVTGNRNLVAHFEVQPQFYDITAEVNPINAGFVMGVGTYEEGESCLLSATAEGYYTFTNWTENGEVVSTDADYAFVVNGDRHLVANFTYVVQNYTINVSANPSVGGTVTGGGTYQEGQSCTIIATQNNNYTFNSWTEDDQIVSTNASYTFTVNDNHNFIAQFDEIPCYAPTNLTATVTENNVFLSWQASSTATGYNIYCNGTAIANNITGLTYTDANLEYNHRYCFTVRAICANGQLSDPSNQACVITEDFVCEVPTNVTAQAINYTDIHVTWSVVAAAESYKIYRNGILIAWDYPYIGDYYDTELAYGEYCYTIVSECAPGDSDPSEEVCVVLSIPCNEPVNFTADYAYVDDEDFGVQLHWSSNAPILPSYFHLYRASGNEDYELVEDIIPEELWNYSYFDSIGIGTYNYMLTAEYQFDGQVCTSEAVYTSIEVTDVNEMNKAVSIYPNPTTGEVSIEGEGLTHIRIVNTYGQTVYNANIESKQTHIDLSHIAKGFYLIHIATNEGQVVRKIVVK